MTLKLITEHIPTDDELKQALALVCSPVFGALNICNALAGHQSNEWRLIRETSPLSKLFQEAVDRGLDLSTVDCAVEGGKIADRAIYRQFMKEIADAALR